MNAVLVTSDITYCPENYSPVIRKTVRYNSGSIKGIIAVKVSRSKIYGSLPLLYISRAKNIRKVIIQNIFQHKKYFNKLKTEFNIPIVYTDNIHSQKILTWLNSIQCDLIVNMRSRIRYKEPILSLPTYGCINIHHGLLPQQRGLFSDIHALARNEKTGYSIHTMNEKIDKGNILYRKVIQKNSNYMLYLKDVMENEPSTIRECLTSIEKNKKLPPKLHIEDKTGDLTTTPTFHQIKEIKKQGIIL